MIDQEVDQRLRTLERAILDLSLEPARTLEFLHVEPDKKRDGTIVGADGIDWNPGAGQGIYAYFNATWNKL